MEKKVTHECVLGGLYLMDKMERYLYFKILFYEYTAYSYIQKKGYILYVEA
jgi:hypothetical protein